MNQPLTMADLVAVLKRGLDGEDSVFPWIPFQPHYLPAPWLELHELAVALCHMPTTERRRAIETTCSRLGPSLNIEESATHLTKLHCYRVVSFLLNTYVWCEGETGFPESVPISLGSLVLSRSEAIGISPITTHFTVDVLNWTMADATPHSSDVSYPQHDEDIQILHTFTGTKDEEWFFHATILVEIAGHKALRCLCDALLLTHADSDETDEIARHLDNACVYVGEMTLAINRMGEHCSPDVFYQQVRPYLAGWTLPTHQGLKYEGATSTNKEFSGASAAQSAIIASLTTLIGEHHADGFLARMKQYMPATAREFIAFLATKSVGFRTFLSAQEQLKERFNTVIAKLKEFRSSHISAVTRYISIPASKHSKTSLSDQGTGGTNLMVFLKQTRQEGEEAALPATDS
eukprot:m.34083 g.34083  ORF g.34083 m.34083 type:complete len:405 (+) comp9733_c0_seq2:128-1342(+)